MNAVDLPLPIDPFSGGNCCGPVPSAPRFKLIHRPEDAHPAHLALISQAIATLRANYDSPRAACRDPLRQGERRKAVPAVLRLAYPDITPLTHTPAIPAAVGFCTIRGWL